jgi:hypothetical protein
VNETLGSTGMGPEEPVVSSRSGHRNRNVFMLGGLALVLVAGVILAGVFPTGDRAGTTATDPSASPTTSATPSDTATDDPTAEPVAVATCAEGGACVVGDIGPGGGLVFYNAGSRQDWGQFLELAPKAWYDGNADPTSKWCNAQTNVQGTGKNIGWGWRNTAAVDTGCTESAAAMAKAYVGGEKGDWFLPSKGELQVLSAYVQDRSNVLGSYTIGSSYYWSSTQPKTSGYGWAIFGTTGRDYVDYSWELLSVRPVRAF